MGKGIALYIHIPFCKAKCLYCDFPSFCGIESYMEEYSEALAKEILKYKNYDIDSIFIGGGTPTYLSLKGWSLIRNSLDKLIKSENCEFTIEGNPGTFEKEKLEFFKDMGVNRLSIGLQAWQDRLLKKIGRIHSINDFLESFNMARGIGFSNINVDLIFGLPSQSLEEWEETLEKIVDLNPEHISAYSLILEEGTILMEQYEKGNLEMPSEDVERDMYDLAINILKKHGYEQYEISNFSKVNRECRHNLVYWSMMDYVGCGLGAHSYLQGKRFSNLCNIDKYIKDIKEHGNAKSQIHINTLEDEIEEYVFMGLRKRCGISKKQFEVRFNRDIYDVYGEIISKYIKMGLLEEEGEYIALTSTGVPISNTVMSEFILDRVVKP